MVAMKIDGRCHCGNIQFEAVIDPDRVSICHCTDCQALTSRNAVRLTGKPPKVYVKTGDNGNRRFQYFCPDCGSPMFTGGEGPAADDWGIRWGSIRQRRELRPKRQIWCRSAVPWVDRLGELPSRDTD
jgi:hypothetical protein